MKFLLFLSSVDCFKRMAYQEQIYAGDNKYQIRDRVQFAGLSCPYKEPKVGFLIKFGSLNKASWKTVKTIFNRSFCFEFFEKNSLNSMI